MGMMRNSTMAMCRWLAFVVFGLFATPSVAAPATLFQITSFADPPWSLAYQSGFVGTADVTTTWPAEMGWQGDTIDIGFNLPAAPPLTARHYRFRMMINSHYDQSFAISILAGPSQAELVEVHSEFIGTARVLAATIPLQRFVVGQTNWIRIQGIGVQVGGGQPPGIQWNRWLLTRTDAVFDLDEAIDDQLERFSDYVLAAIAPSGLVRDSLTLSPSTPSYHPASPDAGGFALLALCAMDHLGLIADAESRVQTVLSAYAGHTAGVTPARNAKGHWWHWMNLATGAPEPGWDDNYTTIGSALLVAGALFAKNHFTANATIAAYAEEMRTTCDFDGMIHPSLDGRVSLVSDAAGNALGYLPPWNEYMIIVSLALRQTNATRASAVAPLWLDPANAPKRWYRGIPTLTDNPGAFASAFWVQQQYYFNADFASNADFVAYLDNHRRADALYCAYELNQNYRYGLTAGVVPGGYRADRINDHVNVYSPEAVGGWGDLDTLLEFVQDQPPGADIRTRYGLTRVSSTDAAWWPADAGLVDHLFLMYGLVEARSPLFFKQRQPFQPVTPALKIVPAAPGQLTISWTPNTPGFALQETAVLSPATWTNSPSGTNNPVNVPVTASTKFYRLSKP
jgi:hypothetical protein